MPGAGFRSWPTSSPEPARRSPAALLQPGSWRRESCSSSIWFPATAAIGETVATPTAPASPSHAYRQAFTGISTVLADAIAKVHPGLRACDLDQFVRTGIAKLGGSYPHHTGHGLGISWHEEPRIVPYNPVRLEPDMIIALEPGMYFEGRWGMRLEYVLRVTASGAEVLSKYRHAL